MLNDASGFKRIFLAAGFTDLRRVYVVEAKPLGYNIPKGFKKILEYII